WGQCGGNGYNGSKTCVSGYTCKFVNDWYSQCQPGAASSNPAPTSTYTPPPASSTSNPGGQPTGNPSATGLHAAMKRKGKQYFGSIADGNLLNNAQNVAVLKREFGVLTPENSMKWDQIEASQNTFNFAGGDAVVNFAQQNGMGVRGHTLVWHSQLPGWVNNINDKTKLTQAIENHIEKVMGRWKGKIFHWDVVNEMFNEDGSTRQSVFSRVLGEDFVRIAFQAARRVDPDCILYINDYNLDSANSKVNGLVNLVKRQRAAGTPIDGIGTQAHLESNGAGGVAAALSALAGAGVAQVAITELDIKQATPNSYAQATTACMQQPKCVGITVWGTRDTDSWRSSSSPLLFDGSFNKKPAYTSVLNAI
ncbi:glycoside hydrolase, partial [Ascobolus immersus RN42]